MAIQGFPFTSVAGDRTYGAADFASYEDVLNGGKSGVISGLLNELAVTSLGAYQTQINTGGAVFTGYAFRNTSAITQTHDAVASGSKRYDLIVFTLDSVTTRQFSAAIVKGTATTGTAVVPTAGTYDTVLATLYINNTTGTPVFTITDSRTYFGLPVSSTRFAAIVDAQYPAANLLTKLKTVDGAGSALIAEGIQTSAITDLDLDPTTLGLAIGETRLGYGVAPLNDIFSGRGFTLQITAVTSDTWNVLAIAGIAGEMFRRRYSGGAWLPWFRYNPYRTYSGGSVSGTVTLPSIEIGETMEACYTATANGTTPTLPASGTYNVTQINHSVTPVVYFARAGGTAPLTVNSVAFCVKYTRTA